ncbi:NitT/TauT family transport system ATP-binding protein [Thermosyntropha lipolytica DSM 11003]|uniref:ABC-type quaternary amine transporter n=1 Tax=Thermosyntropha lipolytica DSM 11003 TaxID=1123382 RepID=A0A1M5JQD4_9FIRM|nr:ABC transporter ATP-binding protein SaoA [Thermosyntropha lipolytica]SHG42500.1 NitT/TauT family transport system ATP-binding protein [Thermosyntropha lipolytica DSM 11003]
MYKMEVKGLSKSYEVEGKRHIVLEDINLKIMEGQFVSLLGPSGCGKTTLLTIMGGFQRPDRGEVFLEGKKVEKPGPERAFVFQNYALFPWMTVKENILYPLKKQRISKKEQDERLEELLNLVNLKGKENLYPHQLSGGMKQRTAVARGLAPRPQVLLMDEPLGALDFQMRKTMQEEMEQIFIKDKTTVIMVTHDVEEAVYLSDRIIVMSSARGTIIEDLVLNDERPRNRMSSAYRSKVNYLMEVLRRAVKGEFNKEGGITEEERRCLVV